MRIFTQSFSGRLRAVPVIFLAACLAACGDSGGPESGQAEAQAGAMSEAAPAATEYARGAEDTAAPANGAFRFNVMDVFKISGSDYELVATGQVKAGSIATGKLADLVVLEQNLFETPPLEIHTVNTDMTVL